LKSGGFWKLPLTLRSDGAICLPSMTAADNPEKARPTSVGMSWAPSDPVGGVARVDHVDRADSRFPRGLLRLRRPPKRLWYRGVFPGQTGGGGPARQGGVGADDGQKDSGFGPRAVAIVGARAASARGCQRAFSLARELGDAGFAIVSGGAYGIDAAAHAGALAAGAPTFAILGCGVDVVYPDRHADLFARIVANGGGLLSELEPGVPPRAQHFPSRNRLIAALCQAVVVIEARVRSGSLITARCAIDLAAPVLASAGSPGADSLLAMPNVAILRQTADVLDVLAGRAPAPGPQLVFDCSSDMGRICAALSAGRASPEALASRLDLPIGEVMGLLGQAELEGRVRRSSDGLYEVSRVHE